MKKILNKKPEKNAQKTNKNKYLKTFKKFLKHCYMYKITSEYIDKITAP